MQPMSCIQHLLKYEDEVLCRRAISVWVFQILSPVSHYASPFFSGTPSLAGTAIGSDASPGIQSPPGSSLGSA